MAAIITLTTPTGVPVLRARYADIDQVGLVRIDRGGGALANPDAIRIGTV